MKRSRAFGSLAVALMVSLALAAAGCGGSSPDETPDGGVPASGAAIPGGGLTIADAMVTAAQGPLLVTGYLIERDGELRLCSAILESYPPQCGEPSLEVQGDVDDDLIGERVSLVGDVEDGVLTVSATTQT